MLFSDNFYVDMAVMSNDTILKNPTVTIDGVEITPTSTNIKINRPLGIKCFYLGLKLTDENIRLVKSTKEQVKAYQATRYIENPVTLKVLDLENNERSINSTILDIDYKIIDFNSLHLFCMKDDDHKYLIEPQTYKDICSNDEFNKIIVYGVFKEISDNC